MTHQNLCLGKCLKLLSHMSDICLISSKSKKLYDSKISGLTLSCEDERILKGKELFTY